MTAWALALALAAWGEAPGPADCAALGGLGCAFVPSTLKPDATLVLYLRGHHPRYRADVPDDELVASARQAFVRYRLGAQAKAEGFAVLVTGRSALAPTPQAVEWIEERVGFRFRRYVLASHSGGYRGLDAAAGSFGSPARLLMLDNFYFDEDEADRLAALAADAPCVGFYTEHNKKRYQTRWAPRVRCDAADLSAVGHDEAVARCLGAWAAGRSCP